MKQTVLRSYAKLIARMGVNIQKGQDVIIYCQLDQPRFIELLVDECYKAGARKVWVEFFHQPLYKLDVRHMSVTNLAKVEEWEKARLQHYVDILPCTISLISSDPDGLKGINQGKVAKADQKSWPIVKPYYDQMENKQQWCIAAVPGAAWAKKVFPGLPKGRAIEKLWEAILFTSRADGPDPIAAWEEHNKDLHDRCRYLNDLGIKELHYKGGNGTDLTVGMIPEGTFMGASETSLQGIDFNANIPSEECFTSPMKGEAEGIVYGTKPLCWNGQLVENFWIRFHEGKAVEWHAEKNESLLGKIITMDEGSAYLGECALVPYDSPISRSGLLFYNTLFDENAACHLALGMGFADTIRGFENMSLEEVRALPGIYHVRLWLNEGDLALGDDIMLVLVGGDIRPRVIDALQFLVGKIKNECVVEQEIY